MDENMGIDGWRGRIKTANFHDHWQQGNRSGFYNNEFNVWFASVYSRKNPSADIRLPSPT